jgi:multiple sugar transport system substrate-binding protein
MRIDRRQFVAGAAALPAFAAAGCGRSSADVEMWAMGNEAAALPELLRLLGAESALPSVSVQPLPWTAAHEKLLTGFAGGALPTLSQVGNSWIAELAAIGAIEPVPDAQAGLLTDQFDAVIDTCRIGNRIWAVPWYVDTRVQFYRRDLFARAGYDAPPPRWDEWKAALQKVKRVSGEGNYGVLMPVNEYEHLTTFALSAKASMLSVGGTRGAFGEPEFLEALGFYKSLFDEGLAPLASATQISNVWNEFARGYFSVYPSGPWTIGDMQTRLPEEFQDKWGTAPNPGPDGAGSAAPGGSSLVVFRGAAKADEAWAVVGALLGAQGQATLQKLTGDLPARKSAWTSKTAVADSYIAAFASQLDQARALPKVPEWERIVSEMQIVAERMLRGQFSVKQAAAEMDVRANRLLEKRRWMVEQGRSL